MTFEMTYGRAGYAPNWVQPDNYRDLGVALLLGISDYCNGRVAHPWAEEKSRSISVRERLQYPALYLPAYEDASKR